MHRGPGRPIMRECLTEITYETISRYQPRDARAATWVQQSWKQEKLKNQKYLPIHLFLFSNNVTRNRNYENHFEFSGCANSCHKFVSSRSWYTTRLPIILLRKDTSVPVARLFKGQGAMSPLFSVPVWALVDHFAYLLTSVFRTLALILTPSRRVNNGKVQLKISFLRHVFGLYIIWYSDLCGTGTGYCNEIFNFHEN